MGGKGGRCDLFSRSTTLQLFRYFLSMRYALHFQEPIINGYKLFSCSSYLFISFPDLWNWKFNCCVQNFPSPDPILSYLNLFLILTPYLCKIHFNITLSSTPKSPKWFLPLIFCGRNCRAVINSQNIRPLPSTCISRYELA